MKDFYFSKKSFEQITILGARLGMFELVCEAYIDEEWKLFTEQIDCGESPESTAWGDLVFVGSGTVTRYTEASKWLLT